VLVGMFLATKLVFLPLISAVFSQNNRPFPSFINVFVSSNLLLFDCNLIMATVIDPILKGIIESAFLLLHLFLPKEWQLFVTHSILMSSILSRAGPIPMLLCRPTGGGKSSVRDIVGFLIGGGVALCLVPLLALAGDQTTKLLAIANRQCNIKIYNLDEVKNSRRKKILQIQLLEDLDPISGETVFLFASPQTITRDSSWQRVLHKLALCKSLKFVSIDECHLFANFGVEFRKEFVDLKDAFFSKLNNVPHAVPILFMTATGTRQMVDELETLTGLSFDRENDIFWPSETCSFARRDVNVQMKFNNSPLTDMKATIRQLNNPAFADKKSLCTQTR
jgi:superfamily II DNA helicase RecQ